MLQSLRIRNLAIVEDLRVEFGPGLNVITGETGAGKSLLLGAIQLLLGERSDKTLIRSGADQAAVEAVFVAPKLRAWLDEMGLAGHDADCTVVRRQLQANGAGKVFINDSPATVQALKQIGQLLVDLHGPHDHQSLLQRDFQRDVLDAYGRLDTAPYRQAYRHWQTLQAQRAALDGGAADVAQQVEVLQFQIREIEQADLTGLDEAQLLAEHSQAANAQRILELTGAVQQMLTDGDDAAFERLAGAQRRLNELARMVPEARTWQTQTAALAAQVQELSRSLARLAGKVEAEPQRLQWLEQRLATLQQLKRKYGGSLPATRAFLDQARQRLTELTTREERIRQLDAEIIHAAAHVETLARQLSAQRRQAGKQLAAAVTRHLRDLGFAHGGFGVSVHALDRPGPHGADEIEFGFAPNVGEPARPLRHIASSGELSRVMLATKVVLAEHDRVTVLVFDEIDANVGGPMGTAIGEKLRALAAHHQVLCISHLPQVAARGDHHLVVRKTLQRGRTLAGIETVSGTARVEELARMLGGKDSTSVALRHARELLERCQRR